jgi:F420-non-reducing hydrogenase iron-sulfur subunit
MHYPANIRVIRMMCTGRMDPVFVFKAFQAGADGVIVSGCHPGDCHYQEGNFKMLRRAHLIKMVLGDLGIHPDRFRLIWVSASEGDRWARFSKEFTETIRTLGPLKLTSASLLEGSQNAA